jgi:hypothetical protein
MRSRKERKRERKGENKLAALQKTFECLTCKAPIKLERDRVNNKWIRYNLDGTIHVDQRKQQQKQQPPPTTTDNNNRSAAAAEQMSKKIAAIKASPITGTCRSP